MKRFSIMFIVLMAIIFFNFNIMSAQAAKWVESIGGTGSENSALIDIDDNGNIYVAGRFASDALEFKTSPSVVTTLTNAGGEDSFIAKYDSDGNCLWVGV